MHGVMYGVKHRFHGVMVSTEHSQERRAWTTSFVSVVLTSRYTSWGPTYPSSCF